jgi:abhydrolase domain-containing protein 8
MFCFCHKCCNRIVEPSISPTSEQFVKVKNNRNLHLLHLKPNNNDQSQLNPAYNSDSNSIHDDDNEENFKTFSKLLQSNKFNLKQNKTIDGFYEMEGDFTIIYKNKIQPQPPPKLLSDQSNKPMLFFLHGVGGSSKIWINQLQYFNSKGYEIVAIDLNGHGMSEVSNDVNSYQFIEMALDVLLVFDMFKKNENVVIGHSYGCSFTQYISQFRKESITKIILISGGSPHPLDFKSSLLSLPLCFIKLIHPILNCHFYCNAFKSYFKLPRHANDAFNISSKTLLFTMKGQIWKSATEEFHKQINQPVLLIEGKNDKFVPIYDALDMIKVLIISDKFSNPVSFYLSYSLFYNTFQIIHKINLDLYLF